MKYHYLIAALLVLLISGCASSPPIPETPLSSSTIEAATLINKMLIDNYDDDFYMYHGIKATVKNNSILVAFFLGYSSDKQVSLPIEEFNSIRESLVEDVYSLLGESEINCNEIKYIIVYGGPIGLNMMQQYAPFHVSGAEYARHLDNGSTTEEFLEAISSIRPTEEAAIMRKQDQRTRAYVMNWGHGTPRESIYAMEPKKK